MENRHKDGFERRKLLNMLERRGVQRLGDDHQADQAPECNRHEDVEPKAGGHDPVVP